MSEFLLAIPTVLRREGGLVDDPNDAGGITNFGISLRWLQTVEPYATADTVRNMTVEEATRLYSVYWWDHYGYGRILDQAVATKVFDTAVNCGPKTAHKIAQEASGATPDGCLGPESIKAINAYPNASLLLHRLQDLQAAYYLRVEAEHPNDEKFALNWRNRAYDRV